MKKYITGIVIIISLCILTGCGAQVPAVDDNVENMTPVSETETRTEIETTAVDENMTPVSETGSAIKENKDSVFFLGTNCIYIVDKASNQTRILWKNDLYEPEYYAFDGCGVILGEKLYFIEALEDGGNGIVYVLSAINADGTGYEQAVSGWNTKNNFFNSIYYSNNVLYVYNDNFAVQCYQVLEDGSLGEQIPQEKTAFRHTQNLGEDYRLLNNGAECGGYLSPVESIEKYGSLIVQKNSSYVKIDVESGNEEWVNFGSPEYMEGDKAFYIGRQSDVWKLESFDINTKEIKTVGEIKGTGLLRTAYADGTFYYMTNNDKEKITVGCISVADGTGSILFERNDMSDYANEFSPTVFGLRVSGNALYYMDMRDYDAYLIRVDLDNMQQTVLEPAIYSTQISKVGTLMQEHHEIYKETDPDILIGTANLTWLAVDDSYEGSNLIDTYLYEKEVASAWAIFEDNVRADEEFFDGSRMPYSYDTSVSCIRYFDGKYVSFIQEAYDYFGGAHGLPIWEGYAFDLETGERLLLPDILPSCTEEELKDIVTKYFSEKIDKNPDDFWPDAAEVVYDTISLETTNFVLTDEGICFYFHPYSLAAYVEWFQDVTVPYNEFEMTILN